MNDRISLTHVASHCIVQLAVLLVMIASVTAAPSAAPSAAPVVTAAPAGMGSAAAGAVSAPAVSGSAPSLAVAPAAKPALPATAPAAEVLAPVSSQPAAPIAQSAESAPAAQQAANQQTTNQTAPPAATGTVSQNAPPLSPIEAAMTGSGKDTTKSSPQLFQTGPLQQFGYSFFRAGSDPFAAMTDIPVGPDYLLGAGDRINLTVWGSIDGSYPLEVNRSGEIIVPKVGPIKVAGVSFGQLPQLLTGQISRIYRNFQLSVTMGKLRMIKVYVVGNVNAPGDYTITSMSTLLNALSAAGGPTHGGSLRSIAIRRDGKLVDTIDLYDFFLKGDKSRDIRLQPGDTVFVPSIGPVAGIAGNVRRPAIFELKNEKTLKDLLALADGIVPTSYLQRLQISRIDANEKKSVTDVSLDPKTNGKDLDTLADGIQIKDMDLVKIFSIDNTLRGYVRLDGYVLRPGDYALQPGMRIEQILSQGNMLPEHYTESGQLIRLMPPDFHPELIFFNVGLAMAKNPEQNLELKEFDVVRIFSRGEMEALPRVRIAGEVQRPGQYQLFTNMRVSDLLKFAGNPNTTANLKMAEIRRLDYSKTNITPYSFYINLEEAIKGNPEHNVTLQPLDEVVIKKWVAREEYPVMISGEVITPGTFRYVDNMTIRDLVLEAGNVKKNAYLDMVEIRRYDYLKINITPHSFYVNLGEALKGNPEHNVKLQPRDEIVVKRWFAGEEFPVSISGEVMNPGTFRFVDNMTVRDLVLEAGNVKKSAYLNMAEIRRYDLVKINITPHSFYVNLEEALKGNPEHNVKLQQRDEVVVKKWFPGEEFPVAIGGEVTNPGSFRYVTGMKVRDLVLEAGNVRYSAYLKNVEVNRRKIENDTIKSYSINIDLEKALKNDPDSNIPLQPFDTVTVHKIPNWIEEVDRYVTISGEVLFPGTYPIVKGEHISDVLQRSGGITDRAYLRGAKFTRRSVKELQQKRMDEVLTKTQRDIMQKQATLSSVATSKEELESTKETLNALQRNVEMLKQAKAEGRVVNRLDQNEMLKGSDNDLVLEGGDTLEIPPRPSVVNVLGQVFNPNAFLYTSGRDVDWYLQKTGGPLADAETSDMYVIQADGAVFSRQQSFFGGFMSSRLEPGDSLIVPQKLEKTPWVRDIKDITQILANIAMSAGTILLGLR